MIIDTLNIVHFGRFHQKSLRLSPGINVVYGENEAGKSTLHQFIQAMLFGVERLRGKASKKDEYSRFSLGIREKITKVPWSSSIMEKCTA